MFLALRSAFFFCRNLFSNLKFSMAARSSLVKCLNIGRFSSLSSMFGQSADTISDFLTFFSQRRKIYGGSTPNVYYTHSRTCPGNCGPFTTDAESMPHSNQVYLEGRTYVYLMHESSVCVVYIGRLYYTTTDVFSAYIQEIFVPTRLWKAVAQSFDRPWFFVHKLVEKRLKSCMYHLIVRYQLRKSNVFVAKRTLVL